MHYIKRKGWEIPEREATPEAIFLNRRALLGAGAGLGAGAILDALPAQAQSAQDPSAGLYPARRNETYKLDRDLTPEKVNSEYNNFYEFGGHKRIFTAVDTLKTRPWTIKIDGLVEQPRDIGIDDLLKQVQLE